MRAAREFRPDWEKQAEDLLAASQAHNRTFKPMGPCEPWTNHQCQSDHADHGWTQHCFCDFCNRAFEQCISILRANGC